MAKNSPSSKPPESQPTRTRSFKKNFQEQVENIWGTKDPEDTRPILIMAADEGRFCRFGEVRAKRVPEEIRPIIPGTTSQGVYICLRRSGSPIMSDDFLGCALC